MNCKFLYTGFIMGVCIACSNDVNTPTMRMYHSMNTRYNIYYNAKTTFDDLFDQLVKNSIDSLSQTRYIDPVSLFQTPNEIFTPVIVKCRKAIKNHSIKQKPFRKRGWKNDPKQRAIQAQHEYNPFLIHCWLLMGKAHFYNGDFKEAANTFLFIREFFKENNIKTDEATLWLARCYLELGWNYQSAYMISLIKHSEKLTIYEMVLADMKIRSKQYREAIYHLRNSPKKGNINRKLRTNLIRVLKELEKLPTDSLSTELLPFETNYSPDHIYIFHEISSLHDSIYLQAYINFQKEDYSTTLIITNEYLIKYPESSMCHRFLFLQGMSYLLTNQIESSKNALENLIEVFPDSETVTTAQNILAKLALGVRPYHNSFIWDPKENYLNITEEITDKVAHHIDNEYRIVIYYSSEIRVNELIFHIATFNFTYSDRKQLDMKTELDINIPSISVFGFSNLKEAEKYRELILREIANEERDNIRIVIVPDNPQTKNGDMN